MDIGDSYDSVSFHLTHIFWSAIGDPCGMIQLVNQVCDSLWGYLDDLLILDNKKNVIRGVQM